MTRDDASDEITAMTIIARALDALDDTQRARVLHWAVDRYANIQRVRT